MNGSGRVRGIWIKRAHRGPMDPADSATLIADRGIVGNADQKGRRQVTILSLEEWDRLTRTSGTPLDPAARRANLLVEGISFRDTRGRSLAVGDAVLRVRGELKPCERMDEVSPGLKARMWPDWGGGAYATIEAGAMVRVGDPVRWIG